MKTILTIDDQQSNQITINAIIERFLPEFKSLTALSGKEGIELAKKEQPAIILLDIVMPQMDGYEVCKILKSHQLTKHIPIIMLTAMKVDTQSRIKCLEAGADAFLTKPIDPAELVAQVKVVMRIKETEDRLREEKAVLDQKVQERIKELTNREKSYNSLFNTVSEAIYVQDSQGRFLEINEGALKMYGYPKEYLIGKTPEILSAPGKNDMKKIAKFLQKAFKGEPQQFEFWGIRKNGEVFPKEVRLSKGFYLGQEVIFALALDITKRKQIEEQQKKLFNELQFLYQLGSAINLATTLDEIYEKAMDALLQALKADRVAVLLFGADDRMHFVAWRGLSESYRKAVDGHSPWLRDAQNPQPVYIEDIEQDKSMQQLHAVIKKEGIQSIGFFPIVFKGKLIGKFMVYFNTQHSFTEKEYNIVQSITFHIANAIVQKQAEEKLKESERKFNAIFNSNPNPMHLVNADFEIVLANTKLLETLNLRQEDITGKKCYVVYQNRKNVCENCAVRKVFEDKTSFKYENQLTLPNGEINYFETYAYPIFDEQNNVLYAVESTIDITRRKLLEQKLEQQIKEYLALNEEYIAQNEELSEALEKVQESENRLVTFMNAIPDIVCYKDGEGRWLLANKADLELFQLTHVDYVGKTDLELASFTHEIYKSAFEVCVATDEKVWQNRKISYSIEKIPLVSGGYKTYDVIKIPVFHSDGSRKGLAVIGRDITELQKVQADLIKAKDKAQESDRLKSAFLANMSHEIRTPMNGILGFAELLKEPGLSGDEQQNYIRIIEKSGARMLNIINQIIDISKIEAGLTEVIVKEMNINEQIEDIYNFFKPEVEAKGIRFSFKAALPEKEAIIKTDREKVYGVLVNLVKNAIKYSDKGSIEFGYEMVGTESDKFIRFYVKDTGIGIPKERQQAIFDRFVQADIEDKMAMQGAGLGLSISKAYVEMLGGKIWVESTEENRQEGKAGGSAFYFTIPYNTVWETKINRETVSYVNKPVHLNKKLKILIVEDDKTSEQLITIVLRQYSKEVITARTGEEAVEMCRSYPDIDLVLMDINLPGLNGYEATRQIRKFNKKVIIIAQTAFGLAGDREKSIEAGCDDYVSKPINKNELLEKIRGLVSGH